MDPITEIGEPIPQFQLPDIHGKVHTLAENLGKIVVLNFWSAECDWCERIDLELARYMEEWKDLVKVIWIASNSNETLELLEKTGAERKIPTLLLDINQKVADLFRVQITPHFFVLDRGGLLRYQGAWDDITFRNREASQVYIPMVVEDLMNNLSPEVTRTVPYGCVLVRITG